VEAAEPDGAAAPPPAGAAEAGPAPGPARRRRAPLAPGDLSGLAISAADFGAAVARVQPSVRREGFATTPDVTWADVGSLGEARASRSLQCMAARRLLHPVALLRCRTCPPGGALCMAHVRAWRRPLPCRLAR
jgi:hypothetical protein